MTPPAVAIPSAAVRAHRPALPRAVPATPSAVAIPSAVAHRRLARSVVPS